LRLGCFSFLLFCLPLACAALPARPGAASRRIIGRINDQRNRNAAGSETAADKQTTAGTKRV